MKQTMAEKLRAQITGRSLVAYLILGALVLVFVLFDFKQGATGVGSVARINHAQISVLDFQQEVERVQQYYSSLFGGQMDLGPQRQLLQQQAVENLIQQELVAQAAKKEGIIATDAEVRDFIVKDIPVFQENGIFQKDRYMRYLDSARLNPAEFENKVRKDIAMNRSRRFFESVSQPNETELQKLKELKGHKLNVQFIKINPTELATKIKIDKSEVATSLQNPEFMKKVDSEYKATKSEYDQQEEIKVQHILLSVKDPSQEAAVLEKIKDIQKRVVREDFGKVAAAVSEDPGSKAKNGDLGYVTRGRMVKEFEDAAFALQAGQVSEPVKTQFGYHLIKVTEKKAAKNSTLEMVKEKIAEKVLAREKVNHSIEKLNAALKANNDKDVQSGVQDLGLKWDETGFFDLASDVIPKLSGSVISEAVFEVNRQQPLLNRLVREGADEYLIKFKEAKVEDSAIEAQAKTVVAQKRTAQIYESWVNNFRKTSKVTINTKIMQN